MHSDTQTLSMHTNNTHLDTKPHCDPWAMLSEHSDPTLADTPCDAQQLPSDTRRRAIAYMPQQQQADALERLAQREGTTQMQLLNGCEKAEKVFRTLSLVNFLVFLYDGQQHSALHGLCLSTEWPVPCWMLPLLALVTHDAISLVAQRPSQRANAIP